MHSDLAVAKDVAIHDADRAGVSILRRHPPRKPQALKASFKTTPVKKKTHF
jgi:hypothetical protein